MHEPATRPERRRAQPRPLSRPPTAEERAEQTFWQWFAIAVLFFCWVAEAPLCAGRGF